ncbi:hypothetical protein [Streptomyces sp. NPDC058279]|uniref:hypothetical protein n=1 Tax=Streptomyces sp. NPDC058279 TaxID=3346418 RepID=UPI0036E17F00
MSTPRDAWMLTDRDERALAAAAEQRISEPLRLAAVASALRALGRFLLSRFGRDGFGPGRPRGSAQGRESLTCQPTPHTPTGPAPTGPAPTLPAPTAR